MSNRATLVKNWRNCLGICSTRIRKLQEAARGPDVKARLRRVSSALLNAFSNANLAIQSYESALAQPISEKRRVLLMESAILLGSGMAIFLQASALAMQMLREFNWSYRRRITESGTDGLSLEETGSKRIDLADLEMLDPIANCVIVSVRLASENFVLSREF